jgi:hypothetical protein
VGRNLPLVQAGEIGFKGASGTDTIADARSNLVNLVDGQSLEMR